MQLQEILFCFLSYLFGSIPFGKLISSRVAQIDITTHGSKNIGATNVAREVGLKWGTTTLFLDMSKGYLPVFLYITFSSPWEVGYSIGLSSVIVSALVGHQFSIFLGFKGGKGVGTATGIYLATFPLACVVGFIVFVILVYKWDYISLGSIGGAFSMPLLIYIFHSDEKSLVFCSVIITCLIFFKHFGNIQRIILGKERKWKNRKRHPNTSRSLSNSSSEKK